MSGPAGAGGHEEATRESFARQAGDFERRDYVFTAERLLSWIAESVQVGEGDRILDVAGGTGAVGRYLGRDGSNGIVVVDLVPEMLAAGAEAAAAEGRTDPLFVRGDAAGLPFADDQFEQVVTRFALHHMSDPAAAVAEMARVCRPGGRVTLVDMISEPGPVGDRHNELERLRDPSHTTALRREQMKQMLAGAGLGIDTETEIESPMEADGWLDQCDPGPEIRAEIERALAEEADGGSPTGLRARREGGRRIGIAQTLVLLGAASPA